MAEGTDRERLFAELVVEQGLATDEQVEECRALLGSLRAAGVEPLPLLGELLYRKGYLSSGAYARTLRAAPGSGGPAPDRPPEVEAAAALPDRAVGKYVKLLPLGRGGMGEVWKAWDRELGRYVALKFLLGGEEEHLLREARVAAGLVHPNIAPVYEAGTHEGRAYIAMQFVEGTTLSRAGLSLTDTVRAVREAALALDFAHRRGVVHRDVKPENLMVAGGRVYVMDFGLARLARADGARSRSGSAVGTPEYMSPEQAAGRSGRVDARTDVYALGATLYALLAGRPPHRHDDLAALLKMVESEEPAPPRRLNPSVPRELETILLKALEKEPDRRYATAAELADDLGRFLEGEPVRARRAGLFYRLRKRLVKRRAVVAAALAGVLAVSAILAPRWWAERQGREREERLRRADVAALQELGALWGAVVVEKQGLHNPGNDPAEVLARIRAAVERVGDFVRRHPERPQGWYVRARGRLYLGDLRGAEEDLRRALREAPDFAPGWALLGRAKLEQHTSRAYRKDWREASPLLEEARDCLGRARKAGAEKSSVSSWGLAPTQEDEVAETLTDALAEVYLGEAPEGRRRLEEANRRQEQAEYCNWLGVLSGASGDDAAEAAWQTRALAKMAHFAKAYLDRGNARLETDPEGAADDFTRALRIDPRRTPALRGRGVARGLAGDFDGAVADYTALAELDPEDASVYGLRGLAHYERGDLDAALADLNRALEADPRDKRALAARASVRGLKADRDGAMEDYRRAFEIDPDYPDGYANRAGTRLLSGELRPALEDATRSVELDPRRPGARTIRALIRRALAGAERSKAKEHLEAARGDLEKDLEIAPPRWPKRAKAEELLDEVKAALARMP